MNILPFIPQGWLTYIGAALKLLAGLQAFLTAIQGGDVTSILHSLEPAAGLYATGAAFASAGLRRAIARMAQPSGA